MSDKTKGRIVLFLQLFVGAVFIFSGFVKVIDPLGGLYKVTDYLTAFKWDALKPLGFAGMTAMSAVEFVLGIGLVFGAKPKLTSIGVLAFMVFYTPLTLYLAINNPVHDCGCFGDALVITNWQTFWKNVVLLVAIIIVLCWMKYNKRTKGSKTEWLVLFYSFFFAIGLSWYSFENLPIIDFRPYKIGTNMPEAMKVPDDAPKDKYKTILTYQKDGKKMEVECNEDMSNLPDSTWECIDSKSELIEKGYEPPIHDFSLTSDEDGDLTEDLLADSNYVFFLVAHNLTKFDLITNPAGAHYNYGDKVNAVYQYAKKQGYKFYCLTATGAEDENMKAWKSETKAEYDYLAVDEITLKTIVRSSPGLFLIKKGNVINKWAVKNIPTFSEPLDKTEYGQGTLPNNKLTLLIVAILYLIPLGIGYSIFKKKSRKKD